MQPYEYETMRRVEDTYWWYTNLHETVVRTAHEVLNGARSARVLDAGCGTGGNLRTLSAAFKDAEITGVDLEPAAVRLAAERGVGRVLQASVESLPFEDAYFDLVVSLDVLYIRGLDDAKAVKEFHRVLKKNAYLVLNLPAFNILKGAHDKAVQTARRYNKKTLKRLLSPLFEIEKMFYWNVSLFPLMAVWRPLSRLFSNGPSPRSDLKLLPPALNRCMVSFIGSETRLAERLPLPFGSSVFCLAKKVGV